jgi:alpha-L-fucosidase
MTTETVQDGALLEKPLPPEPTPLPQVAAFGRRGLGMFLHWGLYSQLDCGEWTWFHHRRPAAEYTALQGRFDARGFDAETLAAFAKSCGVRYLCLTTRHHEGFSLYDTRGLNTYDAPHSPTGRDLVAEFSAACERHGLGKFFYHTTLDWWHPAFDHDWDAYQDYLRRSVELLCRHYGRVDGLWFDGNWARPDRDWQEDALYGMIRRHQPACIIVNNSSVNNRGAEGHPETDVITFEQGMPAARSQRGRAKWRASEMCDTVNSHWGSSGLDLGLQSPTAVIEKLAACRRVGANYLLNIGPKADGRLGAYEQELFRTLGRWIDICPAAVYEAVPAPELRCRGRDFCLRHGARTYYAAHGLDIACQGHLQTADGQGLRTVLGGLPAVRRIAWADEPATALEFTQGDGRLMFQATPYPYGRNLVVRWAVLEHG